jgi:hypothetical protein
MASGMVRLLTAVNRPACSTKKMMQSPPRTMAQMSWSEKSAPACTAVVIDPISRNPPTLVTIPRAISKIFFMPVTDYIQNACSSFGRVSAKVGRCLPEQRQTCAVRECDKFCVSVCLRVRTLESQLFLNQRGSESRQRQTKRKQIPHDTCMGGQVWPPLHDVRFSNTSKLLLVR